MEDNHMAAQIRYVIDDKYVPVQVNFVSMDDESVMMTKLLS